MLHRNSLFATLGLSLTLMSWTAFGQDAAQPGTKPKKKLKPKPKAATEAPAENPEEAPHEPDAALTGATTKISMNGITAKASAYYRLELRRDDHGLEATDGYTPTGTTTIAVPDFKIGLDGELNHHLSYSILIDTVNSDTLEIGKVAWTINPTFTLVLGVDTVNQGGFENKFKGYNTIYLSPYAANLLPLPGSAPAVAVQAKIAGTVTVQLVEDKPTPGSNDPPMQPAMTVEWLGQFGEIQPLAQVGVYGNGNSKYVSLGANYATKSMQATLDYVMDFHSIRYGAGAKAKRLDTVYNNIVLEYWYKNLAAAEPFVKFIAFAAAEPDEKSLGLEDVSYNPYDADGKPTLDDNATILSLGARMPLEGDALVPYAAVDLVAASFQKPSDPTATEDRGQIVVQLGVAGAL